VHGVVAGVDVAVNDEDITYPAYQDTYIPTAYLTNKARVPSSEEEQAWAGLGSLRSRGFLSLPAPSSSLPPTAAKTVACWFLETEVHSQASERRSTAPSPAFAACSRSLLPCPSGPPLRLATSPVLKNPQGGGELTSSRVNERNSDLARYQR